MRTGEGGRRLWARSLSAVSLGCLLGCGQLPAVAGPLEMEGRAARQSPPEAVPPPLDPSLQKRLATLNGAESEEQLLCLRSLKEAGAAAVVALPALCGLLTRSDGGTDHLLVASVLDVLRSLGRAAAPAAETLSSLLPHRCKLYHGRDKLLVIRLRAYLLVTLGEIGFPPSGWPALLDTLALVDEPMTALEVGAAARAVQSFGPRGHEFTPYLLDTLAERSSEEEFSLQRYEPQFPRHEATTVQVEAVRALGQICSAEDSQALEVLRQLAQDRGGVDRRVVREAQRALACILPPGARNEVNQARR
jgi:hypothetical protein